MATIYGANGSFYFQLYQLVLSFGTLIILLTCD